MRFRQFARGMTRHKPGQMNKLEAAYQEILRGRDDVAWFAFEGIKLRLADKTFYTPDFFVLKTDGALECHETKGFMFDDANVKIKCAAEKFPFRFFVIRRTGGAWQVEEV